MKQKGFLFVLPSLVGVMIFYILPFFSSFLYCFTTGVVERKFVGIQNFIHLFQNNSYKLAINNTLKIVGTALPILLILSVFIALIIERNFKKLKGFQVILLLPTVLPAASMMLIWQDMFRQEGILNYIFGIHIDWLYTRWAPLVIVGLIIWKNVGYNVILLISVLLSMPKEYEEAASLDGASFWHMATNIKIPYLRPVLFFCIVISILNCFKIFREVYLLQGSYPDENLYMLQHFMNSNFINLNYEILASSAFLLYVVIFIIIYIMSYLQQRYSEEM